MIRCVHICGIEAGDHGIKTRLLFRRQGLVRHGNRSVGERVVVQRSIRVQVIRGRTISVHAVRPLLLKRDAEQRDPAGLISHHA